MASQYNNTSNIDTLALHAGRREYGDPLVEPLVQSTTFVQEHVGEIVPHAYSRVSNPTVSALEEALGALEGAPPAVCFASGLAAETALFLSLLRAGDRVVCGRVVYGGTVRFLEQFLVHLGVEVVLVDSSDRTEVERAITPGTTLVFLETPANPTLELTDIRSAVRAAHAAGALVAVDNTFLTPVLQRPLDLGADITVYSTTKFIEGHSAATGGSLVSRDEALLERFRFTRKSTGGIQTPLNAWLTLRGLKTLPLRLRRQSETAAQVASWLEAHPDVKRVNYPGLEGSPDTALAESQHIGLHGAVVSFEVAGGVDAGRRTMEGVSLCALVEHVGGLETLVTHPATMTHIDVDPDERRASGIGDGLIRLSVGLEDPSDIIADLDRAITGAHADTGVVVARGARGGEQCPAA